MTDRIAEHYERVAPTYDEHWSYDPDHVRRFAAAVTDALLLTADDRIADVGCGTGLYTRRLADAVAPRHPVLCVDPAAAMLEQVPATPALLPLHARAEDLAAGRVALPDGAPLDAIVLKEAVHHLDAWPETLAGLASLLSPRGRMLVVMLPRVIQHPLFEAAHERFGQRQPDPAEVERVLGAVGLRTTLSRRTFHVAIERDRYVRLLEERYMSVLSEFSEPELAAGVEQFRRAYRDPVLRFDDHVAFVTARVPHHR